MSHTNGLGWVGFQTAFICQFQSKTVSICIFIGILLIALQDIFERWL